MNPAFIFSCFIEFCRQRATEVTLLHRHRLSSILTCRAALMSIAAAAVPAIFSAPAMAVAATQRYAKSRARDEEGLLVIDDLTDNTLAKPINKAVLKRHLKEGYVVPLHFMEDRPWAYPRMYFRRPDFGLRTSSTPSRSRGISGAARRRHVRTRQGK